MQTKQYRWQHNDEYKDAAFDPERAKRSYLKDQTPLPGCPWELQGQGGGSRIAMFPPPKRLMPAIELGMLG